MVLFIRHPSWLLSCLCSSMEMALLMGSRISTTSFTYGIVWYMSAAMWSAPCSQIDVFR